jgi:hypothetical protein
MNNIYDPITNTLYSLYSSKGCSILKSYIKNYQSGGSKRKKPKNPVDPTVAVAVAAAAEAKKKELVKLLEEGKHKELCKFLKIPIEATNLDSDDEFPKYAYRALRADEVSGALTHGLKHPDTYQVKALDAHIRAGTKAIVKSQYISLTGNKCKAAIWSSRLNNDEVASIQGSSGIFAEINLNGLLVINPLKCELVKGLARGAAMASSELIVVGHIPPKNINGLFKSVQIKKREYDNTSNGNKCSGKKMTKSSKLYVHWFPYDGTDPRYRNQSRFGEQSSASGELPQSTKTAAPANTQPPKLPAAQQSIGEQPAQLVQQSIREYEQNLDFSGMYGFEHVPIDELSGELSGEL